MLWFIVGIDFFLLHNSNVLVENRFVKKLQSNSDKYLNTLISENIRRNTVMLIIKHKQGKKL